MKLSLIMGLIRLVLAVLGWLERARLKAEGRAEANAEANEEQARRIELANAARADADALNADGGLRQSDGYRRD